MYFYSRGKCILWSKGNISKGASASCLASQRTLFFPMWHFHSGQWWADGKELWILCLFIACTEEVNGRSRAVMREGLYGIGLLLESWAQHVFQTHTHRCFISNSLPLSYSFSSHFSFQNRGISHSQGTALKSSQGRWVCRDRSSILLVLLQNKNLRTQQRHQGPFSPAQTELAQTSEFTGFDWEVMVDLTTVSATSIVLCESASFCLCSWFVFWSARMIYLRGFVFFSVPPQEIWNEAGLTLPGLNKALRADLMYFDAVCENGTHTQPRLWGDGEKKRQPGGFWRFVFSSNRC